MASAQPTEEPASRTTDPTRTDQRGFAAVAVGVLFFSTGPVIVAGAETAGVTAAFWRVTLACAFFGLVAAIRREITATMFTRTIMSGIGFGLANVLIFNALQITSVANAVLIGVMQPVPLLIAGRLFFAETVRRIELGWVAAAVGGAALMVLSGSSGGAGDVRGDLLAAGSMLMTAVYFIGAKQAREGLATIPFMAGMWFWAAVSIVPVLLLSDVAKVPETGVEWLRIVGVAALPGMGHFLTNYAHRITSLGLVAVMQLYNPAAAAVLALVFLDQELAAPQWIGMAIVIVSLTLYTVAHSRRTEAAIAA